MDQGFDVQITGIVEIAKTILYPGKWFFYNRPRNFNSFVLNLSGVGKYTVDNQSIIFRKNDFFFLRSGLIHQHGNIGEDLHSYAYVNFNTNNDNFFSQKPFIPMLILPDHGDLESDFESLLSVWNYKEGGYLTRCYEIIYRILNTMIGDLLEEKQQDFQYRRRLQPAVVHIHDHFRNKIKIEELASLCNQSERQFRRCFKKIFSKSPKEYIIQRRFQTAKYLLHNTTNSIEEISEYVGYDSIYNFSKDFKNLFGVSPSEWRKEERTSHRVAEFDK
jgi:AraC-like DNA-binding protein